MTSLLFTLLIVGLAGTLLIEALLAPRPQPFWQRGSAAAMVHLGSWLLTFGIFLLILQRPWFAMTTVLSLQLVVVQCSNTKSHTLNEPFICHDFEYFWDALRHPRLYVPFFGIGLAIAASTAGALAIAAFFYGETSWVSQEGSAAFLVTCGALCACGSAFIALGLRRLSAITLCPTQDMATLGLFASLWAYGVALFRSAPPLPEASPFAHAGAQLPPLPGPAVLPHIVLVQSESFSDPRSWCPDVAPGVLPHWDHTCQQARQFGALTVPAWGANTVRTECAVLTGLSPAEWGVRQFNPYRTLARQAFPSLASVLKQAGYRTVCVHPYPASFYFRHKVMPHLGVDTFIDEREFSKHDNNGQYTGDAAVARKVVELLDEQIDKPLFVFVITMENHGPLALEPPHPEALAATLPRAPWPLPRHQRNLAVYLRHLRQADAMLDVIKKALGNASRDGLLGFYGDHVPILPEAYAYYSPPTGESPYVLWSAQQNQGDMQPVAPQPLAAHELGSALLQHAWNMVPSRERQRENRSPNE